MARRKPRSKAEFLALEQQAWDELNGLLAGLSTKELITPGAAGDWSVKDVWAHLADWMERTRRLLPKLIQGERVKADIQAFNADRYETNRQMSLTTARSRVDQERKRFLSCVKRLPEDVLLRNVRVYSWASYSCYNHYAEHIPGFKRLSESLTNRNRTAARRRKLPNVLHKSKDQ